MASFSSELKKTQDRIKAAGLKAARCNTGESSGSATGITTRSQSRGREQQNKEVHMEEEQEEEKGNQRKQEENQEEEQVQAEGGVGEQGGESGGENEAEAKRQRRMWGNETYRVERGVKHAGGGEGSKRGNTETEMVEADSRCVELKPSRCGERNAARLNVNVRRGP
ncbi:uncharacterized protein MELLADRAFT_103260 [Melampsora larici-populina 98AG31]|uniref:Uncharacterized protein n=1 Tax=Melampsora larici-populina (strain 98AG31 / pathotype 3-4-7) TaxID=747676 RepID=F4R9T7_MELLP|nr:uncharacterized protein MELLADRAFT_103260 [Melampsora larici-populina 98AG31]EGG10580.1 hypothetical protein MELLADRAFT_103260 [Melampsora larici-populina 98AG31]